MSTSASAFLMGGGGAPAAKFPVPGTTVSGTITAEPEIMQQREFGTGTPLAWPDGKPKLQLVVTLATATGEQRVFVKGQLKTAVAQAVKAAGKDALEVGGTLSVTFVAVGEPARPGLSGAKQYTATYTAPATAQAAVLGATGPVNPYGNPLPVPAPGQPGAENPFVAAMPPNAQAALAALQG